MVTIYDVAKSAGVSAKTVSRVLNGDAPVGRKTRESVEKAMAALGYVPSSAARALRSNRSGLVGVVSEAISDSSESELAGLPEIFIVRGVQAALEAAGQTMLLTDTGGDPDRVPRLMRTFAEHRVDGIVHIASYHQRVDLPSVEGIRVVIANGYDDAGTPAVIPDDYTGQRDLIRTRAYRDALSEAGIGYDPDLVRQAEVSGDDAEVNGLAVLRGIECLLGLAHPPTAICSGNDRMAMAVYGLLRARGMRIPEDISVTGYDDYRLITQSLVPQLTSVELPYRAIGRRAAQLLSVPRQDGLRIEIGGDIRWRDSVAPPPQ